MSISVERFIYACTRLHDQLRQQRPNGNWQSVKICDDLGSKWLRITSPVHMESAEQDRALKQSTVQEEVFDEDDDEALPTSTRQLLQPLVIYDIIHSPSYQVPVLYITFKDLPSRARGLPSPEQVYETLVPDPYRQQIDAVGPMGALGMTDHPITSTPAYFVHPCRTAEAMGAVTGGKEVNPVEYLLQWIGVIGQSVGLAVPLELAQAMAPVDGS